MKLVRPLFDSFCEFARWHVISKDIDPTYPLLCRVYENSHLASTIRMWRTLLYVTWYHLGSAEKIWLKVSTPRKLTADDVRGLATGTERRAFRGNTHAADFVNAALDRAAGDLVEWPQRGGVGEHGWMHIRAEIQAIRWGGPWASYKFADLMKHVHGLMITANDIGVGGASETAGPIPGMVRLTGENWRECAGNVGLQRALLSASKDAGVPFDGLDQLETSLCDFNSLCKGSYYVGHDIDDQMVKLADTPGLVSARSCFDPCWRGELGGWYGVRKERKTVFKDTGKVIV